MKQVQRNWMTLQLTQLQVNKIMYINKIGYMHITLMFDECLKTTLETKKDMLMLQEIKYAFKALYTCLLHVP